MNRIDIELETGETFDGVEGLWLAVLIGIMDDCMNPQSPSHREAERIIHNLEPPLPLIAAILEINPGALQKRIIRAVERMQRGHGLVITYQEARHIHERDR
jgi:hypothetical protein